MLNEDMSFVGGGLLYPEEFKPNTQGEYDETTKKWNVNGCCGGGCFVLTDIKYCPWCGKSLEQSS